jgi:hypothetical protein
MQIPESFQLHGQNYRVKNDPTLTNRTDNRGLTNPRVNEILLQVTTEAVPIPMTLVEQTFCHELMHCLLIHAESKMGDDEKFVNLMGNLLHQAWSTMTFPRQK